MQRQRTAGKYVFATLRWTTNENPLPSNHQSPQQVTTRSDPSGVPQEYSPLTAGHYLTLTDARLVAVVKRWMDLPESLREKVEAICLEPASTKKATAHSGKSDTNGEERDAEN